MVLDSRWNMAWNRGAAVNLSTDLSTGAKQGSFEIETIAGKKPSTQ